MMRYKVLSQKEFKENSLVELPSSGFSNANLEISDQKEVKKDFINKYQ